MNKLLVLLLAIQLIGLNCCCCPCAKKAHEQNQPSEETPVAPEEKPAN